MDKELKRYIKENYIKTKETRGKWWRIFRFGKKKNAKGKMFASVARCSIKQSVDFTKSLQETFVQYLFKVIDEKGLKDSDVYKRANVDRKLFSKIRSDVNYKPSKNTVLALAIGLELNLEETKMLLEKTGFALSRSILIDVIVEYYIVNKQYNIFTINQTLDDYKLQPLGSV